MTSTKEKGFAFDGQLRTIDYRRCWGADASNTVRLFFESLKAKAEKLVSDSASGAMMSTEGTLTKLAGANLILLILIDATGDPADIKDSFRKERGVLHISGREGEPLSPEVI